MTPIELRKFAKETKTALHLDYDTMFHKTRELLPKIKSKQTKTGLEWSLARLHTDLVNLEESFERYIDYLEEADAGTKI